MESFHFKMISSAGMKFYRPIPGPEWIGPYFLSKYHILTIKNNNNFSFDDINSQDGRE